MQVVVDWMLTNYSKTGKGKKTLLLLHGWGDNASTFEQMAKDLSDKYTLISLDLPGFGGTDSPSKPWKVEDYSRFISHFLLKLKLKPFAIIGHGSGGLLAIQGLATGQFETKKLVLLASTALQLNGPLKKLILLTLPKSFHRYIKKWAYGTGSPDASVAEQMQETFKNTVNYVPFKDAANVKVPTLLMYGAPDEAMPTKQYGEIIKQHMPHGQVKLLDKSGPDIHHHNQAEVAKYVKEFLK
jgi:pimeloyl-ACP methyl ester carboxylesterase